MLHVQLVHSVVQHLLTADGRVHAPVVAAARSHSPQLPFIFLSVLFLFFQAVA
jgi:hypothetical protein